jgi:hypothetical protein
MATWLLALYGLPAIGTVGTLPVTTINGLINEYQSCLYWLNKIAFEVGAWFMMPTGQSKLVGRQKSGSVKTINACIADENGLRSLTRTRTATTDIIDLITVLYDRDWSQSRGAEAYNRATPAAGSGSRARPELFQFDFISDTASAYVLRDLYLALQQNRHVMALFDAWIDLADIESGDTVLLTFNDNTTGIVIPFCAKICFANSAAEAWGMA